MLIQIYQLEQADMLSNSTKIVQITSSILHSDILHVLHVQIHCRHNAPVQYFTQTSFMYYMYKFIVDTMPTQCLPPHVCTNEYWYTAYLESVKKLSFTAYPNSNIPYGYKFLRVIKFCGHQPKREK